MPPAMAYQATSNHTGLPSPVSRMMSANTEKVQSPMGIPTRMGWIGWPAKRAPVIGDPPGHVAPGSGLGPRLGIDSLLVDAFHRGAAGAAEDAVAQLDPVPDHAAPTVLAHGREPVDGGPEGVDRTP